MTRSLVATLICAPDAAIPAPLANDLAAALGTSVIDWLSPDTACDITLSADMTQQKAAAAIGERIGAEPIDFAILPSVSRRKKALIADMDSTMIEQECIDELAAEVGVKDKVAAITAKAMNGDIEFEPALRDRVALLKGLPDTIAEEVIRNRINLAGGGRELVATMKANGCHCALVSGGFTLFTARIAELLGFDEHHANILESKNGYLTGTVREPVLGAGAKLETLGRIARDRGIKTDDFIAVGDGANDLPMLNEAGCGVALHAKPRVAKAAQIRIDHGDLTALLYLQGYRDEEIIRG